LLSSRLPESATTPETFPALKQETDLRIHGHPAIASPMVTGLANYFVEIMKMKLSLGSSLHTLS
jgi:hypothetical protein